MRGAHLADLHLGFTGAGRTVGGRNGREQDVEAAWDHAVHSVIQCEPELVTIGGDVFDSARPSFHAVRAFLAGIRRLATETDAHIVIIVGNHEAPRTAAALSPVIVAEGLSNVHLVTQPERLTFDCFTTGERVSVACFPYCALADEAVYRLDPDPNVDLNVLLVHAAVKTSADPLALPKFYGTEYSLDVAREADRWDAILLGDFHEYRQLVPGRMAFYSGSIERTSSNIWAEHQPKGFVFYDTASGDYGLIEIPTRPMFDYDLEQLVTGVDVPTAGNVNAALTLIGTNREQHDDAIVRLNVTGMLRSEYDSIDWVTVRSLKERCFHFHLNVEWRAADNTELGDRRAHGSRTIADVAEMFFAEDPAEVRELANHYLVDAATRRAA